MDNKIVSSVQRWAADLDEVFTLPDLRVVVGEGTEAAMYKKVARLVDSGVLLKVKRGIYATPKASLKVISSRIEPAAYLSTGTVLARSAIISSIPVRRVQAVKVGRPREYRCALGTIEHLSISRRLYFGFEPAAGILYATLEKAFVDVCYFSYRGKRFSFDPASDVNTESLCKKTIDAYLDRYDPRFVSFFNRLWGDRW